jgi:serine/threonine-protein kinase
MTHSVELSKGLPSSIRAGEVLGAKYRLERELGRGAMGTVWSAVHLTLGQRVAIKLISAEHAQSVEARLRFSDLPLMDASRIVGHVGRALSRAHAQGIVHRDLKPGNIFLSKTDEDDVGWVAKVLDFGIAKLDEQRDKGTTKAGTVLGTPLFMSPEQVRGASSVDHRADLYSLGTVFFNMLTGRYAFNGESFGDVLLSICTEPLPSLRQQVPWLPAAVETWFQRACARDAKDRFQSADEMVEALKLAVGDSLGSISQKSSPELAVGTLPGHSPPVPHQMPRAEGAIDTGPYAMAKTQIAVTDPALAGSAPGTASLTVHEAALLPKRSAWPLALGMGAVALVVVGLVIFKLTSGGPAEPVEAKRAQPEPTQVVAAPVATQTVEAAPVPPPPSATAEAPAAPAKAPVATPPRPAAPRKGAAPKGGKSTKSGSSSKTSAPKGSPDIGF